MDIEKYEDLVFMLHRQDANLKHVSLNESEGSDKNTSDDYYLEGVAAVFGIENNNQRIYDEDEYMPHLEYLQEKIEKKKLVGELDHPEKFDVSLQNISHVVEELKYDKKARVLRIKVKLLNTPSGKIARELVDAGIPISISSRAAGSVGNDKKVAIKKIFTYDLVADPGFQDAQLERVYESNGVTFSDFHNKSITHNLECINESLGLEKESNIEIYKIKDVNEFTQILNNQDKNKSTQMEESNKEFVTVKDMNDYSILIKEELEKINSVLSNIKESETTISESEVSAELEARVKKLENYSEYLAENLDNSMKYGEYLAENLDNAITYSKYLAENLDKSISYGKYIAENLDKSIAYSEYVAENVDKSIDYSKYLAEKVDEGVSYTEYVAENLDDSISYSEYLAEGLEKGLAYSEYIAEKMDQGIRYSEYLAENVNNSISYSDYLAENVNKGLDFSDYLSEKLNRSISYSEYLAENVNNAIVDEAQVLNEGEIAREKADLASTANLNESGFAGDYSDLSGNIDKLIESVKIQKTVTPIKTANTQKAQEVVLNESEEPKEVSGFKFIDDMPEEYKEIWINLNEDHKNSIMAQANLRNLDTAYQIRDFWTTRNLGADPIGLQKLNENQESETEATQEAEPAKTIGYSNSYVDNVAKALEGKFGKR